MSRIAQRGFTLVELMVSLGLGLLLSLAATQLFIANQISFNFQRSTGDVQASGRYAIDEIGREVRMSGLANFGEPPVPAIVMQTSDVPGLTNAALVSGTNTASSGIDQSDQIVLQYATPVQTVDCEGNTVPANTYIVERYFVRDDDASTTGTKALACDSGSYVLDATGVPAAVTNLGSTGAVLASGVESFKVLYGLDDAVTGVAGVNGIAQVARWVDAATYKALGTRPPIVAVKLGLYMRSIETIGNGIAPASDVWVLNKQIASANIPNDNRLRRLFVSSVALNNVDPTGI